MVNGRSREKSENIPPEKEPEGIPWWLRGLRIQHCHSSGCCCDVGWIPALGTSVSWECGQKKKKKKKKEKKEIFKKKRKEKETEEKLGYKCIGHKLYQEILQ